MDSCERALSNCLVLRTIMEHLDGPSLYRMRLINKLWKEESTNRLISTRQKDKNDRFYCSEFMWDTTSLKFYADGDQTFEDFTKSVYSHEPSRFPCSEFHFQNVRVNSREYPSDLANFLSTYGHHIKRLRLDVMFDSPESFRLIHQIIFEWTPYLKFLKLHLPLDDGTRPWVSKSDTAETEQILQPVRLPHLKEICLKATMMFSYEEGSVPQKLKQLVHEVLTAACNLTRISDPYFRFTEEIAASGKARAIHSAILANRKEIDRIPEFSRLCPNLTLTHLELTLQCFPHCEKTPDNLLISNVVRILWSSRQSLKTLDLEGRLIWTIDEDPLTVPIFENVEELELNSWGIFQGGAGRILPPGCNLQTFFPRLRSLTYGNLADWERDSGPESESKEEEEDEDDDEEIHTMDNPFVVPCNSSTTVDHLTIVNIFLDFFNPKWFGQALILYPNVRFLGLSIYRVWPRLPELCSAIWESCAESSLEELSIESKYASSEIPEEYDAEAMERAMTGFDRETCWALRTEQQSDTERKFERGFSIFDMKKLKLFELKGNTPNCYPIFSRVSVIHALEPMRKKQGLKVKINGFEY